MTKKNKEHNVSARLDDVYYDLYKQSPFNIRELIEMSLGGGIESNVEAQRDVITTKLKIEYEELKQTRIKIRKLKKQLRELDAQNKEIEKEKLTEQKITEGIIDLFTENLEERHAKREKGAHVPRLTQENYTQWCNENQLSTQYVYQQLPEHLKNEIEY